MRREPGIWLSVIAAISSFPCVCLLFGYFGTFGPVIRIAEKVPAPTVRVYRVEVERGRIRFIRTQIWYAGPRKIPVASPGYDLQWNASPGLPYVRSSLWELESLSYTDATGSTLRLVACPIWCALFPCLIAPLMWLRRRRRPMPMGFEVITGLKD